MVTLGLALVLTPLAASLVVAGGARSDTRGRASAWIDTHLPAGAKIVLGSRSYAPQRFDRERVEAEYVGRIHEKSLDTLRAEGVDFLVLSSFDTERYAFSLASSESSRAAFAAYRQIERSLPLIARFEPALAMQSYGQNNPVIEIYALAD